MLTRRAILFAACLAGISPAAAQTKPREGSKLYNELIEAMRTAAEAEIGGEIEFEVDELRVMKNWAYASVRPQRPGGEAIDWSETKFADAFESDTMSDVVLALLYHNGSAWTIQDYAIGPTDVAWEEWRTKYRLPRKLFID
jgi:hypothetical protein